MKVKILVLGSNSFSGASFINYALSNNYSVLGVSRSKQPNNLFLPYSENRQKVDSFKFHQLDINKNINEIVDLIKQQQIEYIFNFAAQSMVAESWDNPEHWFMTNTISTTTLFYLNCDLENLS